MDIVLRGKCWKFGDNLSTDSHIMPLTIVKERGRDMDVLKEYVLSGVNPEFPRKVRPGDIIVAGKRFGHGNPHVWGYQVLKKIGVGLVAESIARGAFRNAVTAGLPFLPAVPGVTRRLNQGDEVEVNFTTGEIKDLSTGEQIKAEPLPAPILEIIEAGGQMGFLRQKFARQ